jgi:DNA-binding XRE family transcriptional regulator
MAVSTITRNGKKFALVPLEDYRRMISSHDLPALPVADKDGTCNAIEFARISIARTLMRDRKAAGLSQQELAKLAGVRQETISRIESGKHTATTRIIDKLDRAIRNSFRQSKRRKAS